MTPEHARLPPSRPPPPRPPPLPLTPSLSRWTSLRSSEAANLKMIAVCEWVKSMSQPLGFGKVVSDASSAQLALTSLNLSNQYQSGELQASLNPELLKSEDPAVRAKFWRALSLSCMLAHKGIKFFAESSGLSETALSQLMHLSKLIGQVDVRGMGVSRAESSLRSLNELIAYPGLSQAEKLAKVSEIAMFSLSILRQVTPAEYSTPLLIIGGISASLGLIKMFPQQASNLFRNPDKFEVTKTEVLKKINATLVAMKSDVDQKLKERWQPYDLSSSPPSYDVYQRGNLKQNLELVKASSDEVSLFLNVTELVRDITQFEDAFLDSQDESINPLQIETFLGLQTTSAKAIVDKIKATEKELIAFQSRLEIFIDTCEDLKRYQEENGEVDPNLDQTIVLLNEELEEVRSLVDLVAGSNPAFLIDSTKKTVEFTNKSGRQVDVQRWFSGAEQFLDSSHEAAIEDAMAALEQS